MVGVEWTLLRFVSDGVESVPGDYPLEITLGITSTGALTATDGCNWLSGPVEVEDDRIVAGQLASDDAWLRGPVTQVAPLIGRVLRSTPTWVIQRRDPHPHLRGHDAGLRAASVDLSV